MILIVALCLYCGFAWGFMTMAIMVDEDNDVLTGATFVLAAPIVMPLVLLKVLWEVIRGK